MQKRSLNERMQRKVGGRLVRVLGIIGLVLGGLAVAVVGYLFIRKDYFLKNGLEITAVELREVSITKGVLTAKLELIILSRFPFPLPIDSLTFAGSLGRADVVTGSVPSARLWPGMNKLIAEGEFRVFDYRNEAKRLRGRGVDSTAAHIDATFYYSLPLPYLNGKFEAQVDEAMRVPNPPKFEFGKIRLVGFDPKEKKVNLMLDVILRNHGHANILAENISYRVYFTDVAYAAGVYPKALRVKPADTLLISIPLAAVFSKPGKVLGMAMGTDSTDMMPFKLELEGDLSLPAMKVGPLPLTISTEDTLYMSKLMVKQNAKKIAKISEIEKANAQRDTATKSRNGALKKITKMGKLLGK